MRRIFASAIWMLTAGLIAVGCNQAQPPVNRVQPNVVSKDVFDGEWYFLQTVVDTPYSATYTFVGEQGPLEKITWEVQEDYLIARRSYEHIAGSEPEGLAGRTEAGEPVAMYNIKKHFDIRRQYNEITGEERNVIVENDQDRPWDQREFMRVDWSKNIVTNDNFLVLAKLFDAIEKEPVEYFVQETEGPDHPHAPKFVEGEDGTVGYMDIVNKMFIRPKTVTIEGFGDIPACYLLASSHLSCKPGEVTVRNSFLKVDGGHQYQPQHYTGDRMDRFGYFVTERMGYDDHYGVSEPARMRFVNRHNLWKESYATDAEGELLRCNPSNEEDRCDTGSGSVCDVDLGKTRRERADNGEWLGACTIPFREREVSPITYYLSKNFPEHLVADMEHVGDEWNEAFSQTVTSLRKNECIETGGDREECASRFDGSDTPRTFVLCSNPVAESDHEACGAPGTVAEIGDLRHSLIGWVNEPHAYSPLGYGPSAADPETGEIVMGNAFVYGGGVDTLSTFARDIIALLNGDARETDIQDGELVRDWVERRQAPEGRSAVTGRPADDHITSVDGYNVDEANEAMDFSWVRDTNGPPLEPPQSIKEFLERAEQSRRALKRGGAFGSGDERGVARLHNLVGTDVERMLTGPEARLMAGIDPDLPVTDQTMNMASPLRSMNVQHQEALYRARQKVLSQGSGCILNADFGDDGMLGLARAIQRAAEEGDGTFEWYGQSYDIVGEGGRLDYEKVRTMLQHPIFDSVMAHEVGHTVGLRHNFSGSYDSLNYKHEYWELRQADGDMQPRAWDPLSEEEIDGRIHEYQYSTVMDYGNNFVVSDPYGLGYYDHAAIKMGYGDLVEVFTNAEDPGTINWISFIQDAGWPVPLKLESFTGDGLAAYPYTEVPQVLGGIDRLRQRDDVPYTSLQADPFLQGQGIREPVQDPEGRPAVPYRFCSDEQADLSPRCLRYDAGADSYESINSVIDKYWNYYIFNAFRRGELGFNVQSYASRVLNRYFRKLKYVNQIYSLYRGIFEDNFAEMEGYETFWTRPDGMGSWTAAVESAFELFTRVITTPEPGSYNEAARGNGEQALMQGTAGRFADANVDSFNGRALETTWNFDDGYYWFDQVKRAGFFYDKALATMVLVDPRTNFLGRDTASDVRRYQINYYSSYGPAVTSFFRGLMGEDWDTVAPRVSGSGDLTYPSSLELEVGNMGGTPVDPGASFSIQLYAAVFSMAMIPETFDQSYMNQARIWVKGGAEGVELAEDVPTVEFTDPRSGLTYVAASYPDEDDIETAPGAQMLLHAQALAENDANGELDRFIDNIDIVRRLSWLLEFGG